MRPLTRVSWTSRGGVGDVAIVYHGYSQLVVFFSSFSFFFSSSFLLSVALADPAMVLELIEEWKSFFESLPADMRPASLLSASSPVVAAAPAPRQVSLLSASSPVVAAAPAPVVPRRRRSRRSRKRRRARRAAQRRAALAAPSPAGGVPDSAPSPPNVGSELVSLVGVHCVNEFA